MGQVLKGWETACNGFAPSSMLIILFLSFFVAALRVAQQQQPNRTWMRTGQTALYSTGKKSGSGLGDDDILDAMMAGMESDFKVPTPATPEPVAASTSEPVVASSENAVDPEPTHVNKPVDIEKRLKALSKSPSHNTHGCIDAPEQEYDEQTYVRYISSPAGTSDLPHLILHNSARVLVIWRSVGSQVKVCFER